MIDPDKSKSENSDNTDHEDALEFASEEPTDVDKLHQANVELEQLKGQIQRSQADYLNYRRRMEIEMNDLQKRANANLVTRIFPILDDFERAISNADYSQAPNPLIKGIELVYRNLLSVLDQFGVTKISAKGLFFDPAEHESVSFEPADDDGNGMVLSIIREGYKMNGKVLRPTQVTVGKSKDEGSAGNQPSDTSEKEL